MILTIPLLGDFAMIAVGQAPLWTYKDLLWELFVGPAHAIP